VLSCRRGVGASLPASPPHARAREPARRLGKRGLAGAPSGADRPGGCREGGRGEPRGRDQSAGTTGMNEDAFRLRICLIGRGFSLM
jgi:hypothetical protein